MLGFIDESGDCGMSSGSSPSFTLVAVFFEKSSCAEACDKAIGQLRTSKGLSERFEFHFAAISDRQRRFFFEAAASFNFLYVASTIDKGRLSSDVDWGDKARFYQEACGRLVRPLGELIRVAHGCAKGPSPGRIVVDNNDDPVYVLAMQEQFKRLKTSDGKPLVKKVRSQRSHTSNLLQLADMVCGAVVHEHRDGMGEYRKMIRHQEDKMLVWP